MKRVVVTGATGFVGANLAIALLEAGHEVVATKRPSSQTEHLSSYDVQWRDATLGDPEGLRLAFEGADAVFHCAAAASIRRDVEPWIYEANVTGTANVIDAIRSAAVPRLIHCSTVAAIAISEDGNPVDEEAEYNFDKFGLADAYSQTKYQSQRMVERACADDVDAVIVNPSFMLGPYDPKPSSGELVVRAVRGHIPVYTAGVNDFVDVRDVVRGMISAWERGRRGEKYILSGYSMTYEAIIKMICKLTGTRPPRFAAPTWLVRGLGRMGDTKEKLTGASTVNGVTMEYALTNRYKFTSNKARAELGYRTGPIEDAILDAVKWFREHDMI